MYNTDGSVRIPVMVPYSILPVQLYRQQDLRLEAALNFTLAGANQRTVDIVLGGKKQL